MANQVVHSTESKQSKPAQQQAAPEAQADPEVGLLPQAASFPVKANPRQMLTLQRLYGNRAVAGIIQASRDKPSTAVYEQEADRAADQVLHAQSGRPANVSLSAVTHSTDVEMDPGIVKRLNARRGSGSPLPDGLRQSVEPHFGTNLSPVRLHTDAEAAELNQKIQAKAFTYGSDIYLSGKVGVSNQRVITHELAHVVQQNGGRTAAAVGKAEPGGKGGKTVQAWGGLGSLFGKKKTPPPPTEGKKPDEVEKPRDVAPPPPEVKTDHPKEEPKAGPDPNPYAISNLGVKPDFAEKDLEGKTPDEFIVTVAVARERSDNLKFAKERLLSSIRNKVRGFLRKSFSFLAKNNIVRKPKTEAEIKTKAARKAYQSKSKEEQQEDIQNARGKGLMPDLIDTMGAEEKKKAEDQAAIQYIESQSNRVGHTWVKLSTRVKGKPQEISSFGFWPKKYRSGTTVQGGFGHPNVPVEGMVMHPDTIHEDGSDETRYKDMPVKAANYKAALGLAVNRFKSPPPYVLTDYNCTKFAQEITTTAGASFPGQPIIPGWYADLLNKFSGANQMTGNKEVDEKRQKEQLHPTLTPGGTFEALEGQKGTYDESKTPEGVKQPDLVLPRADTTQYLESTRQGGRQETPVPQPQPEPPSKPWMLDLTNSDETLSLLDEWGNLAIENFKKEKVELKILNPDFPDKYTEDMVDHIKVKYKDQVGMICACDLLAHKAK